MQPKAPLISSCKTEHSTNRNTKTKTHTLSLRVVRQPVGTKCLRWEFPSGTWTAPESNILNLVPPLFILVNSKYLLVTILSYSPNLQQQQEEEAQTSSWLATMEMGNWKGAWGRSGAAPVYRRGPKNRTSEYSCKSYGNPNTPIPHVTHHLWNFRDIRCLCTSAKCHSLSSSSKPSAK